ncbi:hypothetical protein ACFWIW_30750 [Amycolatopsis sp. NPDC058340]|uniref:hypothetical protein n=1 Tax=Amycolatopsis sp. NPDC058340 TaxID=3346453 RepID=UPI0036600B08
MYLSQQGIQPVSLGVEWACRLGSLRYLHFDGRPVVHVSPSIWAMDPQVIRQMAADRRYVEIPPSDPNLLSFQYAPDSFPGRLYDHWQPKPDPAGQRALLRRIRGENEAWLSLRHVKLARRYVAELAHQNGMVITRELATSADRLLLLRRDPAAPPRHRSGFYPGSSQFPLFTGVLAALLCGVLMLVGKLTPHEWLFYLGVALLLPGIVAAALWIYLVPRSTRVGWLANRFTAGDPAVHVNTIVSGLDPELAAQMAAGFGYFYTAWRRGKYEWQNEIVFVRGTRVNERSSDSGTVERP